MLQKKFFVYTYHSFKFLYRGGVGEMLTIGKHIIVELSNCDPNIINNLGEVKKILIEASLIANAEIKELAFHRFSPQGVSGVVVIAESHISVHTWPEYGYVALDIYTCGDKADPLKACSYIAETFKAENIFATEIERGLEDSTKKVFLHKKINIKEGREEDDGEREELFMDVVS